MATTALPPGSSAAPEHEVPAAAAPRRRPRQEFAAWNPLTASIVVLVGVAASLALQFTVVAISGSGNEGDVIHGGALVIAEAPLLVLVLLAARRGAGRLAPATFGIRRTPFWPAVGWTVVIYFAVAMLEGAYILLFGDRSGSRVGGGEITGVPSAVLVIIGMALVAPIVEEVAFRGYLFAALTRWRGPWPAALLTGVLFAAAHLAAYPLTLVPLLFFFGFGACLLVWFTRSLLPCIGLHAINNGIVAATVTHEASGWPVLFALLAPAIVVLAMRPLARQRAPQT